MTLGLETWRPFMPLGFAARRNHPLRGESFPNILFEFGLATPAKQDFEERSLDTLLKLPKLLAGRLDKQQMLRANADVQ
jgi:hypothetical protein